MRFLIVLLLFSLTPSLSQRGVLQDEDLGTYMIDFIEEGKLRGFNYSNKILDNLVSIEYANLDYPMLGKYTKYNKTIYVSPYIKVDTVLKRLTLYHEFGHVVRGDANHSCSSCKDIMAGYAGKSLKYYYNNKNMKKELDKMFNFINN